MSDQSHLNALLLRLSNERIRRDRSTGAERKLRDVWVKQCENEVEREYQFLGLTPPVDEVISMDDIMKELEL